MFPTYDLGVSHAETVGARRARKARQNGSERRDSSSTTSTGPGQRQSEISRNSKQDNDAASLFRAETASIMRPETPSVALGTTKSTKSKFNFFGRRNKHVQEIVNVVDTPSDHDALIVGIKGASEGQGNITIHEVSEPTSPTTHDTIAPSAPSPLTVTGSFPSPIHTSSQMDFRSSSSAVEPSNHMPREPRFDSTTTVPAQINTKFRLQDKTSFRLQAGRSPLTEQSPGLPPSLETINQTTPSTPTEGGFLSPPPARGLPPLPPQDIKTLRTARSRDGFRPSTAVSQHSPNYDAPHAPPRTTSIYSFDNGSRPERLDRRGTTFSTSSGYTAPPRYDEVFTEDFDADLDPREQLAALHNPVNLRTPSPLQPPSQPLPVPPRSSARSTSQVNAQRRKLELPHRTNKTPFGRAIARMESAGPRIIATRLAEEWDGFDDDESYQEIVFEKRLWALTAYQFLTQGKQLQSPTHEMLLNSLPGDGRRILNIHGSTADGYILATRYPHTTVYTTTSHPTPYTPPASRFPAPLNHHTLYIPSSSPSLPFPTSSFDAIISRSLATLLPHQDWAQTFHEATRVLKPGARMEVLSVDPGLMRMGDITRDWTESQLVPRLHSEDMSQVPSDSVLDAMDIGGLKDIKRARIALPAAMSESSRMQRRGTNASQQNPVQEKLNAQLDSPDITNLMVGLGRHFYADLYGKFIGGGRSDSEDEEEDVHSSGSEMFWCDQALAAECAKWGTKIVLTITCGEKPISNNVSPIEFGDSRYERR